MVKSRYKKVFTLGSPYWYGEEIKEITSVLVNVSLEQYSEKQLKDKPLLERGYISIHPRHRTNKDEYQYSVNLKNVMRGTVFSIDIKSSKGKPLNVVMAEITFVAHDDMEVTEKMLLARMSHCKYHELIGPIQ